MSEMDQEPGAEDVPDPYEEPEETELPLPPGQDPEEIQAALEAPTFVLVEGTDEAPIITGMGAVTSEGVERRWTELDDPEKERGDEPVLLPEPAQSSTGGTQ